MELHSFDQHGMLYAGKRREEKRQHDTARENRQFRFLVEFRYVGCQREDEQNHERT